MTTAAQGQTYLYNPDWLSEDDLVRGFIARRPLLEFLCTELKRVSLVGSAQSRLLVGVRGSGKTTLLKRLAIAIRREKELAERLIALSFPEELYQVKDYADLWWQACEALADELAIAGRHADAEALYQAVEKRPATHADNPLDDHGLKLLLSTCQGLERRPVLLLDNFDLVLERIDKEKRKTVNAESRVYWALREVLSKPAGPVLIAGSARLSEPLVGYEKAFFDFFAIHRLGKLSLDEVGAVYDHLAQQQGDESLRERLRQRPGRVAALYELTGGNPRALTLIFELLKQGASSRAVDDFTRLLDLTTPYYKARFEDLPEQAQVVMHALATVRRATLEQAQFGPNAASIARQAGLETRLVSAQLEVLIRAGVVEKNAPNAERSAKTKGAGRVQYRIGEQLFRLWLQMRTSRRIRHQVVGLAEFLQALFDRPELDQVHLNALAAGDGSLARAHLSYAMAEMHSHSESQRYFQSHAAEAVLADGTATLHERFAPGDLPDDVKRLAECRVQLQSEPKELTEALLGSLLLSLDEKCVATEKISNPSTAESEKARLAPRFASERAQLRRHGLTDAEIAHLLHERSFGRWQLTELTPDARELNDSAARELAWKLLRAMRIPLRNESQAEKWLAWADRYQGQSGSQEWAGLARAFRYAGYWRLSEAALQRAFSSGENAHALVERAMHLLFRDRQPVEAEAALRRAIELDPTDSWPWENLGDTLASDSARMSDAEAAFARAVELTPPNWHALIWRDRIRVKRLTTPTRSAITEKDWTTVRKELAELRVSTDLPGGWTANSSFFDQAVIPTLQAGQGAWLLSTLRELGYEAIAAPLLLAIEAWLSGDGKALDEVEPELRRASKLLYEELQEILGERASEQVSSAPS